MKIAIQGHPTRGKEVIQILESLGGIKLYYSNASDKYLIFFIDDERYISCFHHESPLVKECFKIYTLEEFEKEFPFKIGDKVRDCSDDEIGVITDLLFIDNILIYNVDFVNSGQAFMPTKQLKSYKEIKEERNITLTLDKAKEWYKKGGELKEIALQAFSEKELNPLPRSWEEFCRNNSVQVGECLLENCDLIRKKELSTNEPRIYKNWIPSRKSAEAHLALIQLEQLRDCWRQGWKPDWTNEQQTKYCVICFHEEFKISTLYETRHFLSFPTKEMAKEFLECFRDLIEKAGDLI